jgi:hypothetical protein
MKRVLDLQKLALSKKSVANPLEAAAKSNVSLLCVTSILSVTDCK